MSKFLIVEDNEVNREFLLLLLQPRGECHWAESGEQGLEMFERALKDGELYDCAVLDIMLPVMDGLQTLEKMRALEEQFQVAPERQVKVIMASALDDRAKMNRAFFQGQAVSYLTKPFTIDQIRAELDKFGF